MINKSLVVAELKFGVKSLIKRAIRREWSSPVLKSRVPVWKIKRLIRKEGLALNDSGELSWVYNSYQRGDSDPLTNYKLDYIW